MKVVEVEFADSEGAIETGWRLEVCILAMHESFFCTSFGVSVRFRFPNSDILGTAYLTLFWGFSCIRLSLDTRLGPRLLRLQDMLNGVWASHDCCQH